MALDYIALFLLILVSETVYERIKHRFRCRYVDAVVAKGMVAETRVYELLEENRVIRLNEAARRISTAVRGALQGR